MRRRKRSFEDLVNENKQLLLQDEKELLEIEKKIELKQLDKSKKDQRLILN